VRPPSGPGRFRNPPSGGRRGGPASRIPDSRPRLRTDSGGTSPLSRTASAAPRGWGAVSGSGRRAEKARRSGSASAPESALALPLRWVGRGATVGGIPGASASASPSAGRPGASRLRPQGASRVGKPGLVRSASGPWRGTKPMEGSGVGRWQQRSDTTDSSAEQGPVVGRSRRLEGSARATSVVRAPRRVVRGFGRWTARSSALGRGSDACPSGSGGRPSRRDPDRLLGAASAARAKVSARVVAGSPAVLRASVTWGSASADRSFTVSRRRPVPASLFGGPAVPGSPGPAGRRGFGRGGAGQCR
jgi:hypothetical protein